MELGYEDILDFNNWEEVLASGEIVFATEGDYDVSIKIDFKVTTWANKNSYIKITKIEEFYY